MSRAGIICIVLALVLGLPLLGVLWAGEPVGRYLEFPPRTNYVQHEPFSRPAFFALAGLIVLTLGPIVLWVLHANLRSPLVCQTSSSSTQHSVLSTQHLGFPWWGWLGIGWTGFWWVLAWTRFSWMAPLQEHTFTPLWLGYTVIANACTFARTGRCMMLHRPRYFLSLFPLSAAFWWTFEYLNRFVQNWYYVGVAELSSIEYFIQATIPFSMVLLAVLGTAELLTSSPAISAGLDRFKPVHCLLVTPVSWVLLMASCLGLLGIGLWPNYLFHWSGWDRSC